MTSHEVSSLAALILFMSLFLYATFDLLNDSDDWGW